jgi:hypothetical protein
LFGAIGLKKWRLVIVSSQSYDFWIYSYNGSVLPSRLVRFYITKLVFILKRSVQLVTL